MSKKENKNTEVKEETALAFPKDMALSAAIAEVPEAKQAPIVKLFRGMRFAPKGFGEMEQVRWGPTIINLRQPTTRKAPDAAQPGDLYSTDTGRVYERPFPFVVLCGYKTRVRFSSGSSIPTCSSEDGTVARNGQVCARCPDRQFGQNNQPPRCSETTNIVATTPQFDKIYVIPFKGTSKKAGDEIALQISAAGEEAYESIRELDTRREENTQGVYYVLKQNIVERTDPAFAGVAVCMQDDILRQREKRIAEYRTNIEESIQRVESISDDVSEAEIDGTEAALDDL